MNQNEKIWIFKSEHEKEPATNPENLKKNYSPNSLIIINIIANKCLLNVYCVSGTALGDGNKIVGKKSKKIPAFREPAIL